MVLSNRQILAEREAGHVVIEPFVAENVRGASVDLTLGEWFYACGRGRTGTYNPFDPLAVHRYFEGPHRAWPTRLQWEGIPDGHPVIMLGPRARLLCHTHEFAGIFPPGVPEMRARSTWGRNGVQVCACAGWGDPGYVGRWTMEVANLNDVAVPLPVGERVAQLVFHETGPVDGTYGDGGKYQRGSDVRELMRSWEPSLMLPRSYKDERKLPAPLSTEEETCP